MGGGGGGVGGGDTLLIFIHVLLDEHSYWMSFVYYGNIPVN